MAGCSRCLPKLLLAVAVSLVGMATAQHYRGSNSANASLHSVKILHTNLHLAHFTHRGSVHVDRIELRSESNDRNAFFVQNPTDPRYPLWVAAKASVGSLWPRPTSEKRQQEQLLKFGDKFTMSLTGPADDVMTAAVQRYSELLFRTVTAIADVSPLLLSRASVVNRLNISVRNTTFARFPYLGMREDYELTADSSGISLVAEENWGVLRGLETLSQLIFVPRMQPHTFLLHANRITDRPAYLHRGLMIDTARHFIHKTTILENLDAMAFNKMNVFHWHIVDDQSFPYLSDRFPQLALKSAYPGGSYFYTASDIREIVEFARKRGIRVVPEFDSPDHTHSWGHAMPDIMSWCKQGSQAYTGPLDPTNGGTYSFLRELFREVTELFPDEYLHLGLDEVSTDCWRMNNSFHSFMQANSMTQHEQLVAYYCNKLIKILSELPTKKKVIVWEDILSKETQSLPLNLPANTIVQVWITREPDKVANWQQRFKVIRSEEWYLDSQGYGADWVKRYRFNPGSGIGGEACMWTEYQSDSTVTPHMWPSVCAVAERLWTGAGSGGVEQAAARIEEQSCRLEARGIRVGVGGGPNMCQIPVGSYSPSWAAQSKRTHYRWSFGNSPNFSSAMQLPKLQFQEGDSTCKMLKLAAAVAFLATLAALLRHWMQRRQQLPSSSSSSSSSSSTTINRIILKLMAFRSVKPLHVITGALVLYMAVWAAMQAASHFT